MSLVAFLYTLLWLSVGLPLQWADADITTWHRGWLPFMYVWISLVVLFLSFLLLNISGDKDESLKNIKFGAGANSRKGKERESNYGSLDNVDNEDVEDVDGDDSDLDKDVSKDDFDDDDGGRYPK